MRGATRDLRKQATAGKRLLWQALRDRRLAGRKFRRQHPIGQFVVDFCCLEEMLAIEIDGSAHAGREGPDFERQRILEAMGFRFVRVSAQDVERDLTAVIALIETNIAAVCSPAHRTVLASDLLPSPAHGRGAGGEGSWP